MGRYLELRKLSQSPSLSSGKRRFNPEECEGGGEG
jgi:hypothetical protein